jgi:hypothetical protein
MLRLLLDHVEWFVDFESFTTGKSLLAFTADEKSAAIESAAYSIILIGSPPLISIIGNAPGKSALIS